MIKTAIFVEGQTELIFIRELLLKIFQYDNIALECFTLFTDTNFIPTEYAFQNPEATYFFQIVNVGNDKSVLTRILKRENHLRNAGFQRIIGLRDMYSKEYRDIVKKHTIDKTINEKFIEGHKAQIKSGNIFFCFAIMEIESWLLGFRKVFKRMNNQLTVEYIKEQLGIDLETINPENTFFHPAEQMDQIFQLIAQRYNKSKGDINSLVSHIEREDYLELLESDKCHSYKEFLNSLSIPLLKVSTSLSFSHKSQ